MNNQPTPPAQEPDYRVIQALSPSDLEQQLAPFIKQGYQPGNVIAAGMGYLTFAFLSTSEIMRRQHVEQATGLLMEQVNMQAQQVQQMQKMGRALRDQGQVPFTIEPINQVDIVTVTKADFEVILEALVRSSQPGEHFELVAKIQKMIAMYPE